MLKIETTWGKQLKFTRNFGFLNTQTSISMVKHPWNFQNCLTLRPAQRYSSLHEAGQQDWITTYRQSCCPQRVWLEMITAMYFHTSVYIWIPYKTVETKVQCCKSIQIVTVTPSFPRGRSIGTINLFELELLIRKWLGNARSGDIFRQTKNLTLNLGRAKKIACSKGQG